MTLATPSTCSILPARASDLDSVCAIANATFTVPWPREELEAELVRPYSALRVLRPSPDEGICAFLNHWVLGDELQIMNIAVLPSHRRHGYGHALMRDAEQAAVARKLGSLWLEVRRSNEPAIRLYEAHGFEIVGRRQRYYSDNGEDALLMKRELRAG